MAAAEPQYAIDSEPLVQFDDIEEGDAAAAVGDLFHYGDEYDNDAAYRVDDGGSSSSSNRRKNGIVPGKKVLNEFEIVVQHDFGAARLRRKNAAQESTDNSSSSKSHKSSVGLLRRLRDAYALRKLDFWQRWEPKLERAWQRRARIGRCVVCLLAAILACFAVFALFADDAAFFSTAGSRGGFVKHGEPGVNFSAASVDVSCKELRNNFLERVQSFSEEISLSQLLSYAEVSLSAESRRSCVCGPMFGTRRNYMAILLPQNATRVLHMYNVRRDAAHNASQVVVRENQRMLFPAHAESVENVRASEVRVEYTSAQCEHATLLLRGDVAYCAQACLDLFNGTSVYEKSRLVSPAHD